MNRLIAICMNYSGIREELTEAEQTTVLGLIKDEFKSLSTQDIIQAFKYNASGNKWKPIEAYQTFSPIFVGKVLQEFKEWKRKNNTIKTLEPAKQLTEAPEDETGERAFNFIENCFHTSGSAPYIANWDKAFIYAENKGLIKMTDKEKEDLKNKVQRELNKQLAEKRNLAASVSTLTAYVYTDKEIKKECRKSALIDYFKNSL